jgi:peptidoglycan/xylan/chitin deacetylase (PgdA/CDA1 family)
MINLLVETAGRTVRRLQSRAISVHRHALVLMYHRIAEPAVDPWNLCVSPRNFATQLRVLRRYGPLVPFGDVATLLKDANGPRQVASITFDDGYRDNLDAALPELDAQNCAATVFVTTGATGTDRAFWWDALAQVFLTVPVLPPVLTLTLGGREESFALGAAATAGSAELRRLAAWRAGRLAPTPARARVLNAVWSRLKTVPTAEAEAAAETVVRWSGIDPGELAGAHPMRADEVVRLAASGLVEIGGHTRSHPALDRLTPAEAAAEIAGSREDIRRMTGVAPRSFAYPYGRFGPETAGLVRGAGFETACICWDMLAWQAVDPYLVPRLTVRNWDGETFARILARYAGY